MVQSLVDIGNLISTNPEIQSGRAVLTGTGTSVRRIAALYKQGKTVEEIVADKGHLSVAQVYAALTYYHANKDVIDRDLDQEADEYNRLSQQAL